MQPSKVPQRHIDLRSIVQRDLDDLILGVLIYLLHKQRKAFLTYLIIRQFIGNAVFFAEAHAVELTMKIGNRMTISFGKSCYQTEKERGLTVR